MQIVAIRPMELIVSLPNQLMAHIPIQNISAHLSKALADTADDSEAESDSDKEDDDAEESDEDDDAASPSKRLATLSEMFTLGQTLPASVVSVKASDVSRKNLAGPQKSDEQYRLSRRAIVSLDPAKVNEGVAKSDLANGFVRASLFSAHSQLIRCVWDRL